MYTQREQNIYREITQFPVLSAVQSETQAFPVLHSKFLVSFYHLTKKTHILSHGVSGYVFLFLFDF